MMKNAACAAFGLALVLGLAAVRAPVMAAQSLDIYFIDVEGGQSTLIVTPAGESLLVDAGFPSSGTFTSTPGPFDKARDAGRILGVARAAGLARIDYLLVTHFHADHDGGVVELSRQIPIRTFIDHGGPGPGAEEAVPGTRAAFDLYSAVRAEGHHLEPRPGDRLPLKGLEVVVVSAAGAVLRSPLSGAGQPNPACGSAAPPAQERAENPRSTGFRLTFGRFRFLDVGDLSGAPLFALVCPKNLVGTVDAYLVAHHGGDDAGDASTFEALRPRVAIVNNGATKGGAAVTLAAMRQVKGLEAVWQLHRSLNPGAQNAADEHVANLDDTAAHWIRLSASEDGSFSVTNGRTGISQHYGR